ncbi:glycosyltransferase [Pseudomonas caspiana]
MNPSRLVSIVIPSYKADYFEASLTSALQQTHDDIEIVICDDCPTDAIKVIVDRLSVGSPWPVRYFRNERALGEALNLVRCVEEAKGSYVKFLYDDDILDPDCVRLLFNVMEANPHVTIATSRRNRVDELNNVLPEIAMTRPLFSQDVVIHGTELASFLGEYVYNFIGEPSVVMCRHKDLLSFKIYLCAFAGQSVFGLGDIALHTKLLRRGNLAMLARPLSSFRVSAQQYSHTARQDVQTNRDMVKLFRSIARDLGWIRTHTDNTHVKVAPLSAPENFVEFDLHNQFARQSQGNRKVSRWLDQRTPDITQQTLINRYLEDNHRGPSILIVITDLQNQPQRVQATLDSLDRSSPIHAQLSLVVLTAQPPQAEDETDRSVQWIEASESSRPQILGRLLQEHQADWFMLVEAGATFTPAGLLRVSVELIGLPACRAIYADEIHQQADGQTGVALRPDFNLDYLLSLPMAMSGHWLFNRHSALEVGGLNAAFAGAMELDLILRLIEDGGLEGLEHVAEPLLTCRVQTLDDNPDEVRTLQRHLEARGYPYAQVHETHNRHYQLRYGHQHRPLISILIPTRDRLAFLQRCVESILEKTSYPDYEILIVDNHSQDAEAVEWLAAVESMGDDKIRVLRYPYPFNFSAINNRAAEQARGEYLVLLNDDTAILQADWLDNLLNHALRPEVGVVGAKLFYPDGTVQHAGMVLGLNDAASHVFSGEPATANGYMQRLIVDQNYSAVTAACLMVRKSLYDSVGGLDESLALTLNDVDFCLKVSATGHLIVWTPHVVVLHETHTDILLDSAREQRHASERQSLYGKWLARLARDPAYNPDFALTGAAFELAADNPMAWHPLPWRPLPVVLAHSLKDSTLTDCRLFAPLQTMREAFVVDGVVSKGDLDAIVTERLQPDSIVLHGAETLEDLSSLRCSVADSKAFKVLDIVRYPAGSDVDSLRQALSFIDRLIVPSQGLADALHGAHQDIRVVENRLSAQWRKPSVLRRAGSKPRVGWAATAATQPADWSVISEVVRTLADEAHWIVMGSCPAELKPCLFELRSEVEGELYPSAVAGLWLDVALAPGPHSVVIEGAEHLQILEYGACGFPVIVSDTNSAPEALSVTRVKPEAQAWIDAIRAHIGDLDVAAQMGDELQRQVRKDWMLEGEHLQAWQVAWLGE